MEPVTHTGKQFVRSNPQIYLGGSRNWVDYTPRQSCEYTEKLLPICSSYGKTKEKDLHYMDHLGSLVLADPLVPNIGPKLGTCRL